MNQLGPDGGGGGAREVPRGGAPGTYPLEDVLGSVLLMPVLAGFRSYARCPCSSPREKFGPVPVTTGAAEGDREEDEGGTRSRAALCPGGVGRAIWGLAERKGTASQIGLIPNLAETGLIRWVRRTRPLREAKVTL